MEYFTENSSLYKVAHCKQFKPFAKYLITPRQCRHVMQVYRIKNLSWFCPSPAQDIAHSLNAMRDICNSNKEFYHKLHDDIGVYSFIVSENRPFVFVLAGGGYGNVCSMIEGFPVAVKLNEMGINAFVGQYSVGKKAHYPNPQKDVADILSYVLENAEKWHISKDYAICGFSAGGHLAGTWATEAVGYRKYNLPKPSAVILAYPVVTMGERTHVGSRKNLLQKATENAELRKLYSVEKQVTPGYPKTFVWQCTNDKVVPFDNSLMLVEALKQNGVKHEFLPVDGTAHGLGLGTGTSAEGWLEKAIRFWQED